MRGGRSKVWAVRLVLVLVVGGTLASLVIRTRRDDDATAVLLAIVGTVVLVAGLTWLLVSLGSRRAARVQREHPGSWVRPVSRGRVQRLLYLDDEKVELLGLTGRTRRSHPRRDLVGADVGPISFPAATRTGLRLRFRDGDAWDLLTTRRGGLASSEPEARSACEYLAGERSSAPCRR